MAAEGADAAEDKYKGHKRPHELIPGYIRDKERIEVSIMLCSCFAAGAAVKPPASVYTF
jgi:hypothetical protein